MEQTRKDILVKFMSKHFFKQPYSDLSKPKVFWGTNTDVYYICFYGPNKTVIKSMSIAYE